MGYGQKTDRQRRLTGNAWKISNHFLKKGGFFFELGIISHKCFQK
jgi:hypothetical protein